MYHWQNIQWCMPGPKYLGPIASSDCNKNHNLEPGLTGEPGKYFCYYYKKIRARHPMAKFTALTANYEEKEIRADTTLYRV